MRNLKLALKVAFLGVVAAVTSITTRQVVAQRPAKPSMIAQSIPTTNGAPQPRSGSGGWKTPDNRPWTGYDDTTVAYYSMPSLSIAAEGQNLVIDAEADIFDRRPDIGFLWSVRIVDPKNKDSAIFEKQYRHQIFSLDENHQGNPTFHDVIPINLPKGTYTVEAIVYQVHSDYRGLDGLTVPEIAKHARGPQGKQKVTIGSN